jgi:perosamine synthetase
LIPLCVPNISGNEGAYLGECVRSTMVSSVGPFVGRFESMAAQAGGAAHAAAVCSGTAALQIALRLLGVGRDDLVILPSFTFIASANAVSHAGATPWLMDIDAETWTLDPGTVGAELDAHCARDADGRVIHTPTGRRVGAIMPVQTFGLSAGLDRLQEIASRWGLPVLADAAAAHGARLHARPLTDYCDLACYSFNGNKTVTAGGGGVVTGNDEKTIARARHLTSQARSGVEYEHDEIAHNLRMTNLQAAVGCAQLERLDEFLAIKRRIRNAYDAAFAGDARLVPFPRPEGCAHAFWFSGFLLAPGAPEVPTLRDRLRERGVEARSFWKPVHLQRPYADAPRGRDLSVSESLWARIITLPCSTGLGEDDQRTVIEAFAAALEVGSAG